MKKWGFRVSSHLRQEQQVSSTQFGAVSKWSAAGKEGLLSLFNKELLHSKVRLDADAEIIAEQWAEIPKFSPREGGTIKRAKGSGP